MYRVVILNENNIILHKARIPLLTVALVVDMLTKQETKLAESRGLAEREITRTVSKLLKRSAIRFDVKLSKTVDTGTTLITAYKGKVIITNNIKEK